MSTLNDMLTELMEETVRRAFLAGHERALTHGQQEAPAYGYEDWRGYGPGALLPGGPEASRAIRAQHEQGNVGVEHKPWSYPVLSADEAAKQGQPPEWPQYSSKVEDTPEHNGRTVTLETRHGEIQHKHGAKVVLDLAQAQGNPAYVDYAIDRLTRSLRADIESCTE